VAVRTDQRNATVDWLKALAIVAVVFTHSGLALNDPRYTAVETRLRFLWTPFHVPTFLVLAGYLYYRDRSINLRETGRRFVRLLVPYLLASAVAVAIGVAWVPRGILFALLTGSTMGIYYFVFALTCCILTLPLLSRLPSWAVWFVLVLLSAYFVATLTHPWYSWSKRSALWSARDPLGAFYLGYFALGWLGAAHREGLQSLTARQPWLLVCFAALAICSWFVYAANVSPLAALGSRPAFRVLYTLGVIALVARLARGRRAPPPVVFLSEVTLAVFLYHRFFQITLAPQIGGFSSVARVLTMAIVGLGGSAALAWTARRVSPRLARTGLGA
jgi:fucose 4-O-acetylase-like acetyltransferase